MTRGQRTRMAALVFGFLLASCTNWVGLRAQMPLKAGGSYRIAGTVVDGASGKPLALTEVTIGLIEGKSLRETYATGADGRFSFEGLPAGKYQISVRRRGYVAQSYKGHDDYWAAIVVGPGQNSDDVRFTMTAGASIGGHVFDERGDGVRDGRVLLLQEVTSGGRRRLTRSHSAELNDLGEYRFWHLEPGAYVVVVMAQPWYAQFYGVNPAAEEVRLGDIDTNVVYPVTFYPGAMDAEAAGRIYVDGGRGCDCGCGPGANCGANVVDQERERRSKSTDRIDFGCAVHRRRNHRRRANVFGLWTRHAHPSWTATGPRGRYVGDRHRKKRAGTFQVGEFVGSRCGQFERSDGDSRSRGRSCRRESGGDQCGFAV